MVYDANGIYSSLRTCTIASDSPLTPLSAESW